MEFNKLFFPLCCLHAEFKASCAGIEWPFQETHITYPTWMNPVSHFIILQLMAFTEKVRLSEYDPSFNIMEKSSWATELVPLSVMTSYNWGGDKEMGGAEVNRSQEAATNSHFELKFSLFTPSLFLLSMQNCSGDLSQTTWCEWRHRAEAELSELWVWSLMHWGSPSSAVYLCAKPTIWTLSKKWEHLLPFSPTFPSSWDAPSFGPLQQRDGRSILLLIRQLHISSVVQRLKG